jgi:hypothetical protein
MKPLAVDPKLAEGVAPTTATNLLPSADEAMEIKFVPGTLFDVQELPEFVEV